MRYSPSTNFDQARFVLTSNLYKSLFNYYGYDSDLRYFMARSLSHNLSSFTNSMRKELLNPAFYKIKPKIENIRDSFNLSDFYSIRRRHRRRRYRRYFSEHRHFNRHFLRMRRKRGYKRYKKLTKLPFKIDKYYDDNIVSAYFNRFFEDVNRLQSRFSRRRIRAKKKYFTRYKPLYDVDQGWLSFVPDYIVQYPLKRHRNLNYDFNSIMTSDVDFGFNANNRRHSRFQINALKNIQSSGFVDDMIRHGVVKPRSLNVLNKNFLSNTLNLLNNADSSLYNATSLLSDKMIFKYPYAYDYSNNLGDVFIPYVNNKMYDGGIEDSVVRGSRSDYNNLTDLRTVSKPGVQQMPFKYVVRNRHYHKDHDSLSAQTGLNLFFSDNFSRIFNFKNPFYLNQLGRKLSHNMDVEDVTSMVYDKQHDFNSDFITTKFLEDEENSEAFPYQEFELISNQDSDINLFNNLFLMNDDDLYENYTLQEANNISRNTEMALGNYQLLQGLDEMRPLIIEDTELEKIYKEEEEKTNVEVDVLESVDENIIHNNNQETLEKFGLTNLYLDFYDYKVRNMLSKRIPGLTPEIFPLLENRKLSVDRRKDRGSRRYFKDNGVDVRHLDAFNIFWNLYGENLRIIEAMKLRLPETLTGAPGVDAYLPEFFGSSDLVLKTTPQGRHRKLKNIREMRSEAFDTGPRPYFKLSKTDEPSIPDTTREEVRDIEMQRARGANRVRKRKSARRRLKRRINGFLRARIKPGRKRAQYSDQRHYLTNVGDIKSRFYTNNRLRRYVPNISAKWKNFYYGQKYYANNVKTSFYGRRFYKDKFLGSLYFPGKGKRKLRNFRHSKDLLQKNKGMSYCLDFCFLIVLACLFEG